MVDVANRGNVLAAGAAWLRKGSAAITGRGRHVQVGDPVAAPVQAVTVMASADKVTAAWEALPTEVRGLAADVDIRPAPGDRGTELRVRFADESANGGPVERLEGESPRQRVRDELRKLKAVVECGEVVNTDRQPSGRGPVEEATTRKLSERLRSWGAA